MIDEYRQSFFRKLRGAPFRHAARVIDLQWRMRTTQREADERALQEALAAGASIVDTPRLLRPPPHHYQDYAGPWIEDYFFRHWTTARPRTDLSYLPVFWTDLFLHAQTHRFLPARQAAIASSLRELLDRQLDERRCYFTVLEYDHMIWDWHAFPRNVAVFSAGGWGDLPIPLLKGSPPFSCPAKDIPLSFVGRIDGASDATGLRSRMHQALRDHAQFSSGPTWRDVMARSTFSLCPRGLGRTSFRLYEALSVGSIPIYLWDDREWLPYRDELDWSEFSLSLHIDRVAELPDLLSRITPQQIHRMQRRIGQLYEAYFTLAGTCRRIVSAVERLADRGSFRRLMEARSYPANMVPLRQVPDFLRA